MNRKALIIGCRDLRLITTHMTLKSLNVSSTIACLTYMPHEDPHSEVILEKVDQCQKVFSPEKIIVENHVALRSKQISPELANLEEISYILVNDSSIAQKFKSLYPEAETHIIFEGILNLNNQTHASQQLEQATYHYLQLHPPLVHYLHAENIKWIDDTTVIESISEVKEILSCENNQSKPDRSILFIHSSINFLNKQKFLIQQVAVIESLLKSDFKVYYKGRDACDFSDIQNRVQHSLRDNLVDMGDASVPLELLIRSGEFKAAVGLTSTSLYTLEKYLNIPTFTFPLTLKGTYTKRTPWRDFIVRTFCFTYKFTPDYRELTNEAYDKFEQLKNYNDFFYHKNPAKKPPSKKQKKIISGLRKITAHTKKAYRSKEHRKNLIIAITNKISKRLQKNNDVLFVDSINMKDIKNHYLDYFEKASKLTHKHTIISNDIIDKVKYLYMANRSKLIVTSINNKTLIDENPAIQHLQIWHAPGAFKKILVSRTGSFVASSSAITPTVYKNFNVQGKVYPIGTYSTDIYFNQDKINERRQSIYQDNPGLKGKKIYLFAPSYTKDKSDKNKPIVYTDLNYEQISQQLHNDEVLIVKHHPSIINRKIRGEECTDLSYFNNIIDLSHYELFDLLTITNSLTTDYSSVIYYAMLLEIPVAAQIYNVAINPNDLCFDFFSDFPGPINQTNTTADFIALLRNNLKHDKYDHFKEQHLGSCDGNSRERLTQVIEELVATQ
ncbi:CDP-glycerol glycerophosphotransferase (TagB/SpsB family) [Sinobacterium caligoides]|uniref:CDP-glycerol glycerophosphotransferase (TagB/SpsB family) n=1 Tax=Sinobacterium caligoides TaxID=933926 RepID=A0A3N2DPT8_9GAMM|nr:CDP-glycerol glycerophosphotransferase family protein [Sinobacterium caligoides]ROS01848.1 CDP-glycerol glycerophosphotransferase (TagB/SpsB family) [Sinobacterium caligoides]